MRLQDSTSGGVKPVQHLWETIERLRVASGRSHDDLAGLLRLTSKKYERLRGTAEAPAATSVLWLAEELGVAFDRIMTGEVDFRALAARSCGDLGALPERYSVAAFSRRRTSINLLEYLEDFYGWRLRGRVLRHFQLNEEVFSHPDATINIRFIEDTCSFLKESGLTAQDFFSMGAYSVVSNQDTDVGRKLSAFSSPKDLYEELMGFLMRYFERNHDYRLLSLDATSCVIQCQTNPEVADGLSVTHLGNEQVCQIKAGVAASIPGYLGLPLAEVEKLSCVHRGDLDCRFHVDFSRAAKLSATGYEGRNN